MSRVYLNLVDKQWKEVEQSDFWIDEALYSKLMGLEMIQEKGWDGVIVVDGKERSGKSVLAMVMGWYLSKGTLTLDNFARGLGDAAEKIARLPDKSVMIVDEASTVFASKDSMTDEGKQLIKIMDVVGQKNMIFILCLPCFFDLNKTMAVRRSLFLCHVYPDEEYNRGRYAFWGERSKKNLFIFGKKNYDSYSFPPAEFVGEYMAFEPPFYKEYKEIVKKESLREVLNDAISGQSKQNVNRAVFNMQSELFFKLKTEYGLTTKDLKKIANLSEDAVNERIRRFKELNVVKTIENDDLSPKIR